MSKNIIEMRAEFEKNNNMDNSEILLFSGCEDLTVYNCSVPLVYQGETYIYGRVEKKEWHGQSNTVLFKKTQNGVYELEPRFLGFGLEDPFWERINGEYIFGGNIVIRDGKNLSYRTMFFRSRDIFSWRHFAVGPDMMKDIRLVQLPDCKIGVFTRPRSQEIKEKYGSESMVGFLMLNSLEEFSEDKLEEAVYIPNFFDKDEWGGVNQAFYLGDNKIGIIGHQCYSNLGVGIEEPCYLNIAFVYDMQKNSIIEKKIIATRNSYPKCDSKIPGLYDCAFTSGIVFREDGFVDLYSGLGDMFEGVKTIENPFANYMK